MFDMGPYYLTALTSLIGPVRRVTGSTRASFAERVVGSEPLKGTVIKVNTPTHIVGVLDFAAGAIATIVTTFDVWSSELPRMEIYGAKGTLSLPDPNTFGGPVRVQLAGAKEWTEVPITHGYTQNSRGLGVADMAYAIQEGREHRANGELAYHVLDLMHTIHDASREGRHIEMSSTCHRPEPLPERWPA
jgi:predicted dehydrogenase